MKNYYLKAMLYSLGIIWLLASLIGVLQIFFMFGIKSIFFLLFIVPVTLFYLHKLLYKKIEQKSRVAKVILVTYIVILFIPLILQLIGLKTPGWDNIFTAFIGLFLFLSFVQRSLILRHYKKHRIVYINFNVIFAGLISAFLALYPVQFVEGLISSVILLVLVSYFIDGIIDFAIFGGLHFLMNFHLMNKREVIVKDAIRIQKHRIILQVVFFFVVVPLNYVLLMNTGDVGFSFLAAYISGILLTRIIHTAYGLKHGLFKDLN